MDRQYNPAADTTANAVLIQESGSVGANPGFFARIRNINDIALNSLSSLFVKNSTRPQKPDALVYDDDSGRTCGSLAAVPHTRQLDYTSYPSEYDEGSASPRTHYCMSAFGSSASSKSSGSDRDLTPPLTPDFPNKSFDEERSSLALADDRFPDELQVSPSPPPHPPEVKEGKKPERHICFDTLIEDYPSYPNSPVPNTPSVVDDSAEWVGLEYTIELSTRERHISDSVAHTAGGEHSKSRESWAAIHVGTLHPIVEEEEYMRWVHWHRYLDQLDNRRRHRKGFAFRARARDVSMLYLEEFRLRDIMYRLKPTQAVQDKLNERLALVMELRPDPYHPPQKHTDGWFLKRSRSISCLAELHGSSDAEEERAH
ncbi:hypothetical protein BD626DRAFT_545655 [Schizophyllum amplum]|uniref:Uncharacterized protein n=1 Tax=Schizophyllum amplum TaxID=97359 RepID=A0A550CUY1_9AGAR|nr:hypothetical protein BD626DRAFT_545655 [Auriculariopsis ampla]